MALFIKQLTLQYVLLTVSMQPFSHTFSDDRKNLISKRYKPVLLLVGYEFVDAQVHLLLFSQFLLINISMFGEISDRVYHDVHRDVHQICDPIILPKEKGKLKHMTFKRASRFLPNSVRNIYMNMSLWHRIIEFLWNGHFSKSIILHVKHFACNLCVCTMCMQYLGRSGEGLTSFETGVKELRYEC